MYSAVFLSSYTNTRESLGELEKAAAFLVLPRLRAVSLFLENPWERTQNKKTCKRDCERDLRAAMPLAASSVGVGRRVKRETALVSYNDLMLL